jgi:gluconate 2-dehydrogenase gamma chain
MTITRRDILRNLGTGIAATSVLRAIPATAAEHAHQAITKQKATAGSYTPKYFNAHEYRTLTALCRAILPSDQKSPGAVEAGAPEFIDLLTGENEEFQRVLGGGLIWLDAEFADRYGTTFLASKPDQQTEVLDLIAYRKNAEQDSGLSQPVQFFTLLRNLTCDAYFTSEIGIRDLGYIGNTFVREFHGCPPLPE